MCRVKSQSLQNIDTYHIKSKELDSPLKYTCISVAMVLHRNCSIFFFIVFFGVFWGEGVGQVAKGFFFLFSVTSKPLLRT